VKWKGAADLRPLLVPISELDFDRSNARSHNEYNLKTIRESLEEFGQRKPVVAHAGVVKAGNGTLAVARELGWTHIAVSASDDLSSDQADAYGIVDNRSSDLSEWNERLSERYAALPTQLRLKTGFKVEEVQKAVARAKARAEGVKVVTFTATEEQADVIRRAIAAIKSSDGLDLSDGRCLELISADYLSGF
jgi:hypothetical protein